MNIETHILIGLSIVILGFIIGLIGTERRKQSVILLTIGCLMIIFGFAILLFAKDEFNPQEDVCLQWGSKYCGNNPERCWAKACPCAIDKCLSWREKSYCEKNPNDNERCVCDEYEGEYMDFCMMLQKDDYINFTENETSFSFTMRINNKIYWSLKSEIGVVDKINNSIILCDNHKNLIRNTCVKAHEPNECEKGNPAYILTTKINKKYAVVVIEGKEYDCSSGMGVNLDSFDYNIDLYSEFLGKANKMCFTEETVCRKKTIYDESCERLAEAINHGEWYCKESGYFQEGSYYLFTLLLPHHEHLSNKDITEVLYDKISKWECE